MIFSIEFLSNSFVVVKWIGNKVSSSNMHEILDAVVSLESPNVGRTGEKILFPVPSAMRHSVSIYQHPFHLFPQLLTCSVPHSRYLASVSGLQCNFWWTTFFQCSGTTGWYSYNLNPSTFIFWLTPCFPIATITMRNNDKEERSNKRAKHVVFDENLCQIVEIPIQRDPEQRWYSVSVETLKKFNL